MEGLSLDAEAGRVRQASMTSSSGSRPQGGSYASTLAPATMYRGTMLSTRELDAVRQIEDVVRLGRVRRIEAGRIVLERGETETGPDVLHVDCTALGLNNAPATAIFQPGRIVLQQVRFLSPTFNAALVGFVEATRDDDADKNRLCPPNPYPSTIEDWPRTMSRSWRTEGRWLSEPDVSAWVAAAGSTFCRRFRSRGRAVRAVGDQSLSHARQCGDRPTQAVRRTSQLSARPPNGSPQAPPGTTSNLVFCYEDGRMYSKDALNWRFSKMTRRAGIGHWHAHEGRHTAVAVPVDHEQQWRANPGDQRHRGPQVHARHRDCVPARDRPPPPGRSECDGHRFRRRRRTQNRRSGHGRYAVGTWLGTQLQTEVRKPVERWGFEPQTSSLPSRGKAVFRGHWGRSEDSGGHIRSVLYGAVAALCCCTPLPSLMTLNRQWYSGERDGPAWTFKCQTILGL